MWRTLRRSWTAFVVSVLAASQGAAQSAPSWQLRDRGTKLHLIAAGFLNEDADHVSLKTVAVALQSFRAVHGLTVDDNDGSVSDQDLAGIARSANEDPFSASILNKPLAPREIELLRAVKAEMDRRMDARTTTSSNNVRFLLPEGFVAAPGGTSIIDYKASSDPGALKARVVIENITANSIGANRRTLMDLLETRTRQYVAKNLHYEALNVSMDRVIAQFVFGLDQQSRYFSRTYLAGDRLIGLGLAASVDPAPGFVPIAAHRLLAEHAVDKEPLSKWLTLVQCSRFKLNCDVAGLTAALAGQAGGDELRATLVRAVAWRALTNAVAQTIMSDFDDNNGWQRFPAQECYFERRKPGIEQVRIIAGSDRRFDAGRWVIPSNPITDAFDESTSSKLGLYCVLVEMPKEPASKLPNTEQEGYRIARQPSAEIGSVPLGFDRFSITDSTRHRPGDRALVYIHGFYNTMKDAIDRTAQIGKVLGSGYWGRLYLYSWPSAYSVTKYVDDLDRSEQAETHLRNFIRMIARDPNVERIDFVAHSMGSALLLRALSGLSVEVGAKTKHIGQIILAAPDIQSNVFASRMALVAPFASRVTIYGSDKDRALAWRRWRYGGEIRIGARTTLDTTFKNVHFVDVSEVLDAWYARPTDYRHDYFASNPKVLADIADVLKTAQTGTPERQEAALEKARKDRNAVLQPADTGSNAKIWKLMP